MLYVPVFNTHLTIHIAASIMKLYSGCRLMKALSPVSGREDWQGQKFSSKRRTQSTNMLLHQRAVFFLCKRLWRALLKAH